MAKTQNITLKSQPSKGKGKNDEIILIIQGELTVDNSRRIKDFFLNALKEGKKYLVKVNNVDNIDLGFIQLLQRFQWDAMHVKKEVEVSISVSEEFQTLLSRAGFNSIMTLKN
jgi:ABC-type transporter Mla MlaB component